MTIKNLVEDAKVLWDSGRKESAFALILIAFAATARRRYPRPMRDNMAFKEFIRDELPKILGTTDTKLSLPFKGKRMAIEDILYEELRCQLVHEGNLPDSIIFTPRVTYGDGFCDRITLTAPFGMPESWVLNMARVVAEASENAKVFGTNCERTKPTGQ